MREKMSRFPASSSPHLRHNASFITTRDGIRFSNIATPYRQIMRKSRNIGWRISVKMIIFSILAPTSVHSVSVLQRKGSHVSAVEPFTTDILNTNITLNGVDIKVFCGALGDGFPTYTSNGMGSLPGIPRIDYLT